MPGRGKGKHSIQYVQNEEPAFIRQFKERIGYDEGPVVNTKRQRLEINDEDDDDDDKPEIVVLKEGDLTAEEVEKLDKNKKADDESTTVRKGKIVFTKPTKKENDTKKSKLNLSSSHESKKELKKDKKPLVKEVRNSNLLSFDDEEEDDT